jgi:hypothetical protein
MPENREYFRIKYPVSQRPRLVVGTYCCEILELSEVSASVSSGGNLDLNGGPIKAAVSFLDGTRVNTAFTVLRRQDEQIVLRFSPPLPFSIVMAEQRRLLKAFPMPASARAV